MSFEDNTVEDSPIKQKLTRNRYSEDDKGKIVDFLVDCLIREKKYTLADLAKALNRDYDAFRQKWTKWKQDGVVAKLESAAAEKAAEHFASKISNFQSKFTRART